MSCGQVGSSVFLIWLVLVTYTIYCCHAETQESEERNGRQQDGDGAVQGHMPPVPAGLTTADKLGIAFVGGVLVGICILGVCWFMHRRCRRQPQPEEVVVVDEELATPLHVLAAH